VTGSGVTASLAGSPSQCAPGHPSTFDVSFTAAAAAAPTARNLSLVFSNRASQQPLSLSNALHVYDTTPVITSLVPFSPIYAGGQAYVMIYGLHFGSSGTVQVCTNATGACVTAAGFSASLSAQYSYWSDTQVNILLTSPSYSAGGTYYLQVVTSTDLSGSSFLASTQESSGNASNESPFMPAPDPTITSLMPATGPVGGTVLVNISGYNFGTSPTVTVKDSGGASIPATIGKSPRPRAAESR